MPFALISGLAPIGIIYALIGGNGTRLMIRARQAQESPSRAAWLMWGIGWGVTFAVLAVLLVAIVVEAWHGLVSAGPFTSITSK